jgi:hypothetical protein
MCSETPIMKTTVGERNGRKTLIAESEVDWTKGTIRSYEQICGACPVAENCCCLVRSAYWYIHSELRPSFKQDFPQSSLLTADEHREILIKPSRNRHRQAQVVKIERAIHVNDGVDQLKLETA